MSVCNLSLQIIPAVPPDNIHDVVDKVIALIQESGIKHIVGPMETTMEGELPEMLEIVQKAQQVCVEAGASRVCSVVKIDYKVGGITIEEKIGKYREQ